MVDTAIIRDQLTVLAGTVADHYKPRWFRQALNVTAEVPEWAEIGQYIKVEVASDMKLASYFDTSVPLASHKRSTRTFDVVGFINGYRIGRKEVLRASQDPSYQLEATLALANQRKAESVLQAIAMTGGGWSDLEGILTLTDSSTLNPTDHAGGDHSFVDQAGAVLADVDFAYCLAWFDELFAAYRDTMGDELVPDRCIVPALQSKGLRAVRHADTLETAWDRIQSERPGVQFFESDEANAAGGANTCRLVLFSSDLDVAKMVVPEEYHDLEPFAEPVGSIIVPSVMSSGGVISNYPTAVLRVETAIPAP